MRREGPGELVRRLHVELLEEGRLEKVDEFFDPAFVSHNNPPGFPEGRDGVREFFRIFRDALSDIEVTIDELIVEGDWAAVATTLSGIHRGELLGIPPTGRPVAVTGIDLVRVEGKIVEHRGLTDTAGLVRQLTGRSLP